jgi:signal transduction histidine kinase
VCSFRHSPGNSEKGHLAVATTVVNTQARSVRIKFVLHLAHAIVKWVLATWISLGRHVVPVLSGTIGSFKQFVAKYPAVLSGYIIYSYLFIAIMRFFLKAKSRELTPYDVYETFDALPFMWLLSSALVKVIDMRTKLHNIEKERIMSHRALEIKQAQLETMREVAIGFQHRVNNPLAIISLVLGSVKRSPPGNPMILERMSVIEESASRIKQAVIDFSEAQKYEVELIGPVVGSMASPASLERPIDGLTATHRNAAIVS